MDIKYFFSIEVEVRFYDGIESMICEEVLLIKIYEIVMKGGIMVQWFFMNRFDEKEEMFVEMQFFYQDLMCKYVLENLDFMFVDEMLLKYIIEIYQVYIYLYIYYFINYLFEEMLLQIFEED